MSAMKDVYTEIQDLLINTNLSFVEIAKKLNVPLMWVFDVADRVGESDE
jgi:hypothetical protein